MRNLIPHFISEKVKSQEFEGGFPAYTMFLDMSGFTRLTEHLIQEEGSAGAEVVSQIINNIFGPLVSIAYKRGGFIPYFAGDAFTAVFPETEESISPEELADMALEIQKVFSKDGDEIEDSVKLKIGLSHGQVDWGIAGKTHKGYYFNGPGIDQCAQSEHLAEDGDVIIDEYFLAKCTDPTSHITCKRLETEGFYKVVESEPGRELPKQEIKITSGKETLRPFLPDAVLDYADDGEFRDVVSVFLSFKGLDDTQSFNEFVSVVAEMYAEFSGYFKEIDFGDKGGVIVGFFGAPVTYGDNVERALRFVTALRENLEDKEGLEYKIGMTSGRAFTGFIGGEERCQYAAVGHTVNLAARLMVHAEWGEVLVDAEIEKEKGFRFRHAGDIRYKGVQGSVSTYAFLEASEREEFFSGEMIGRDKELKTLVEFTLPIFENTFAGVAVIYGEAGIGKSRLAYEMRSALREKGEMSWYICQADQILQKPFNPFVYLFRNLFEQTPNKSYEENKAIFEKRFQDLIQSCEEMLEEHPGLEQIIYQLTRTKTVIAARLGLYYEGSLWSQLDAQGRYRNTISAFINVLKAEALIRPFVLEVEDGHWFDDSTKALLSELVVGMREYPACLVITSRYNDEDQSKPNFFSQNLPEEMPFTEVDLNTLSSDAVEKFAELRLGGKIKKTFRDLLIRTTSGNPFYTEQILEYFSESGLLAETPSGWDVKDRNIKVSGSINAVLMARIDRLSSLVKETVKAAAVIGREFEVQVLSEVMKQQKEFVKRNGNTGHLLLEQIESAEKGQIWKAVNEIRYIFKHSLLREAVYDMQLRTRLRELHKLIAEAIEKLYAHNLRSRYADLAFHYEQSNVKEKMVEYLEKAGDYYKANFQNRQAISYYDKLADNLNRIKQQPAYVKTLLKKADILELIGDWTECERILQNALGLAGSTGDRLLLGRANNDLGNLLTLKGEYEEAKQYLEVAAVFFEEIDDQIGMFKVYGNLGNVYFRQGDYEKAKDYYKESLRISDELQRSDENYGIVSYLGLSLMNQGQYDEAIAIMKPQLERCEQSGNKQGIANIGINLGIVLFEKGENDEAMLHYEKGLKECEDLDNKFLTAIALGCMGKVLVKKGQFEPAQELYQRDLDLCRDLGDPQGLSITLGLMGDLLLEKGEFNEALKHLDEQLRLSEDLNYQKGIASALGSIGDAHFHKKDYDEAHQAFERAIRICEEIENRRLLIMVLIRMVELSLATGADPETIRSYSRRSDEIADQIGNEELMFITSVKRAQVELRHGNKGEALTVLHRLLGEAQTEEEKAEVLFVLATSPNVPDSDSYREECHALYKKFFERTPKFDYMSKMAVLQS